jgi:rubrerythrin
MKIGLIILFGLYLFKLFQNRAKEKREYDEATQELYQIVKQTLSAEALKTVQGNNIWKGMPECLMYYVYGRPYEIGERETPGNLYKTWFYRPIPNARSNARRKYKTEIYSENGFITHWDILN